MKVIAREILEKGSISIKSDNNQHDYILRVLDINDLSAVMKLQSRLIDMMQRKELYVPIIEEEMVWLFEGAGEALGLYIDNTLYAACSLLSRYHESNMARELNFAKKNYFGWLSWSYLWLILICEDINYNTGWLEFWPIG